MFGGLWGASLVGLIKLVLIYAALFAADILYITNRKSGIPFRQFLALPVSPGYGQGTGPLRGAGPFGGNFNYWQPRQQGGRQ